MEKNSTGLSPKDRMQSIATSCYDHGIVVYETLFDILDSGSFLAGFDGKIVTGSRDEIEEFMILIRRWSSHERFMVAIFYMYMNYLGDAMVSDHSKRIFEALSAFNLGEQD